MPCLRLDRLDDRLTPVATLDPTFATGGRAALDFGPDHPTATAAAVAALPDGRVVVAGTAYTVDGKAAFAVARLLPDGRPDPAFAGDGTTVVPFDRPATPTALTVLSDGRVLVAGSVGTRAAGGRDFAAVRLRADGTPDPGFGTDGRATVGLDLGAGNDDDLRGLAVLADGRAVLVGTVGYQPPPPNPFSSSSDPTVTIGAVRLLADGTLDPDFGTDGRVGLSVELSAGYIPYGSYRLAVAAVAEADGGVVLVGERGEFARRGSNNRVTVERLDPAGQLVAGFGDTYSFWIDGFFQSTDAYSATRLADGRVAVAGERGGTTLNGPPFWVARFGPAGGLAAGDPAYFRLAPERTRAAAFRTDGGAVLAGRVSREGEYDFDARAYAESDGRAVVAMVNPDGSTAEDFGRLQFDLDPTGAADRVDSADAAAVLADGRVVVAGTTSPAGVGPRPGRIVVARLVARASVLPAGVDPPVLVAGPAGVVPLAARGTGLEARPAVALSGLTGPRATAADLNADGVAEAVAVAGPGGSPRLLVLDGNTGAALADFPVFEAAFTGGLFVAAADLTGDGVPDVVVTPDRGGGPVVVVYDGAALAAGRGASAEVARFLGIEDANFRGGARPAVGDIDDDGTPDLLVAAGFGGGPRLAIYDGETVLRPVAAGAVPARLVADFFVFEESLRNGAFVAAGDLFGVGTTQIVAGGGPGGGPRVLGFFGQSLVDGRQVPFADFFAGDPDSRGGVRVAVRGGQLVTGSGDGEPARVRVYPLAAAQTGGPPAQEFSPFDGATLADGVYVG